VSPGFKYNMTDIQAALGLAQLARFDKLQRRRAQIFTRYNEAFAPISSLQTPDSRPEVEHARHLYVLRLRDEALRGGRDEMIARLKARRICTSVHFIPVHLHTYYRQTYGYRPHDFPVALTNYQRMLSLPLSPALSDNDVSQVIDAVCDAASGATVRLAG
jgi:dTDP-4-amino-4,6-dideoxygalactose transaminase